MGLQRFGHDWVTNTHTHTHTSDHIIGSYKHSSSVQFSLVAQSCLTLLPHGPQHTKPPCPSPTPGAYSNSCLSSRWCHPSISSSVVPFSSCLLHPASWSSPGSQFFTSGGQSIRVSASASVVPMNIQDWFPLRMTGLIFLQSKGLSRVFSNITVQKHQFFDAHFSRVDHSWNLLWVESFVLCDWLISLSKMYSRFIHVVALVRISFLCKAE